MNLFLRMACRVIERRMEEGEPFEQIVTDYPKLTDGEVKQIRAELGVE